MRLPACLILGCLGLFTAQSAVAGLLAPSPEESEILPAEDAFQLRPALWESGKLTIALDIAPGCYLYRSKLIVEAIEPAGYALGAALIPAGEPYRDEHFGEVAIFRKSVEIAFKPSPKSTSGAPKKLRVRYQGCAENKVCYPLQTRVIDVLSP